MAERRNLSDLSQRRTNHDAERNATDAMGWILEWLDKNKVEALYNYRLNDRSLQ